jgi:CubicO group peptidase (beta-lactamase class C family)
MVVTKAAIIVIASRCPKPELFRMAAHRARIEPMMQADLARRIDEHRQRLGVPGLAAVGRTGADEVRLCAGTDPATGHPVLESTRFALGSVAKPVAALAAAAAHDAGLIDWGADIAAFAPATAGSIERNGCTGALTVRDLVAHTAGLSVHGFLGYGPDDVVPSLADVIAGAGNSPRIESIAEPGALHDYSGGGYVVLEAVVEEATGRSFAVVVDELVLGPAAMATASFVEGSADSGGAVDGVAMAEGSRRHPERAAAGLRASLSDLGALVEVLLDARREPSHRLAPALARVCAPAVLADGRPTGSGHGIGFIDADDRRWYTHRGRNLGFCALVLFDESGRFGAAVATNSFPAGTELARDVITELAGALDWPGGSPLPSYS